MNDTEILVSISCITYNHATYIRQCIDGFLMQKTDFKYEVLIHDDASTDGTTEIIKEYEALYPDIIKPIYENENQWVKGRRGSREFNLPRAKGEYIAYCEGDDYWTDPLKLQKQVDILKKEKDVGLVYSKVRYYYQKESKFREVFGSDYIDFKCLLKCNCIPTLTVLIRKKLIYDYEEDIRPTLKEWKMGDYPMWLWFARNSKLFYLNEIQGVYRVLENSVSHSTNRLKTLQFMISSARITYYFACKYNTCELERLTQLLWIEFEYAIRLKNIEEVSRIVCKANDLSKKQTNLKLLLIRSFSHYPKLFIANLVLFRKLRSLF